MYCNKICYLLTLLTTTWLATTSIAAESSHRPITRGLYNKYMPIYIVHELRDQKVPHISRMYKVLLPYL